MTDWLSLFAVYRAVVVRNDEIVQGVLHPDLSADHPLVRSALQKWEGTHFVHTTPAGVEVTLVRRIAPAPAERWWLHILLAALTFLTTTAAGANFLGREPFVMTLVPIGSKYFPVPVGITIGEMLPGLAFSVPLLAVLLGHEMGHYLVARRHGMNVSPPYFIPAPHWINVIGTFGAFIRLRSAVINRQVLLDVGMAGPLVSFALSIPLIAIGLGMSQSFGELAAGVPSRYAVLFQGYQIWLGGSLLFHGLDAVFGPSGSFVILHPLAFAGWVGLFVTALNLFPLAQLDGGHILYSLVGARQRYFGLAFLGVLIVLGYWWWGWWLWAGLIIVIGRGSVRHPSVFDPVPPVRGWRRALGWFCVLIFVLTFVVFPIKA